MSIVGRGTLKSYFDTGDVPTESQFDNLIDSLALASEVGTPRVVYAADYGADGAYATDASTALAALITAETAGGVIYLGPGIHRVGTAAAVDITDIFLLDVDPNAVIWVESAATFTIKCPQIINVRWFGAIGRGAATGTGCAITSGSDQLTIDVANTSLSVPFKVGGGIVVPSAGVGSANGNANPLYTRIKAISGSTFTLEDTASQTVLAVTGVRCLSDDSIAFNDAIEACFSTSSNTPRKLYVPAGAYQVMQPAKAAYEFSMIGDHRLRTMLYQASVDGYHWPDCILRIDGNVNLDIENIRFYNDTIGTCIYSPKRMAYTVGNTREPKQTDVLFGHNSGAQTTFTSFDTTSSTWAAGTAAGTFYLATQTGTFTAGEKVDILKFGAAITLTNGISTSGTNTMIVVDASDIAVSDKIAYLLNDGTTYQHNVVASKDGNTLTLDDNHDQNVPSGRSVYVLSYENIATVTADPTYGSQLIDSLITNCWFAGHGYGFSQASAMDVLASTTTISDCAIEMLHDGIILRGNSAGCHMHNLTVWMIENQAIALLGGSAHSNNVYNCQISNVIHSTTYTNGTLPCTINVEYGRDIQISNVGVHNHMSAAPIITTGLYTWVDSGTNDEWYLTYDSGTVASVVIQPHVLLLDGSQIATGTIGALTNNTWAWGTGALGYSTIYIKLTAGGAPATSAVYRMWYSDAAIRLYLCQSVKIDGITAENVVDVPSSGNTGALVVWGGTQQSISNLHAVNLVSHPVAAFNLAPTDYMHHGIWAQAVTDFHVSDFYIYNTYQEGIDIDTSGTNVTIEKGYIRKTGMGGVGTYASLLAPANPYQVMVRDIYFNQDSGSTYALDLSAILDGRSFVAENCYFYWADAVNWAKFNATPNTTGQTALRNCDANFGPLGTLTAYDATPSVGLGKPIYATGNTDLLELAYTDGGVATIVAGLQITGATSEATARVLDLTLDSGSWAGGNAAGTLYIHTQVGTFESENLNIAGLQDDICTIGGDSGATTYRFSVTDFDDGYPGQQMTVKIADDNTKFDFTSSGFKGNIGVDWEPATGDHMTCTFDGTDWYCDISDNTA